MTVAEAFSEERIDSESGEVDKRLFRKLERLGMTVAFAESCTGGLAAKRLTDIPGASSVFWGACVSYSNDSKSAMLGIESSTIAKFGAVSRKVVEKMAAGLMKISGVETVIAFSGIAGPDGGSARKPVGTVWICAATSRRSKALRFRFSGDRSAVRERSVTAGFLLIERMLDAEGKALTLVD
jgi:PncC family amidohydrolase